MIVDRGFRNVMEYFKSKFKNVETKIPTLNTKGRKQTVEEANQSRMVTKILWVVEAYHGRVKKWKILDHRQRPHAIEVMMRAVKVVSAMLNAFRPPHYRHHQKSPIS